MDQENRPHEYTREEEIQTAMPPESFFQKAAGGIVVALVSALVIGMYNNWSDGIRRDEAVNTMAKTISSMNIDLRSVRDFQLKGGRWTVEDEADVKREYDRRFNRIENAMTDLRIKIAEIAR